MRIHRFHENHSKTNDYLQASINGDNWLSYDWNTIYTTNQNTANRAPITLSHLVQVEFLENGEFDFVLFLHDFVETLEDFFKD